MKQVQDALSSLGIPVFPDVWRSLDGKTAPPQYVVYVRRAVETDFYDGLPHTLVSYIYLNLWSSIPPTAKAEELKHLMWAAGFEMEEELTGTSVNATRYDEDIQFYCVSWTWVLREEYSRQLMT